jgi:division protein CdvB (Snf7/Vps24/ESCRT-III family)
MNNIQLLKKISKKINKLRDKINLLSLQVVEDENYDLVFDNIVDITFDLENITSKVDILSEEIDII